MSSELFRFAIVRPPQMGSLETVLKNSISLSSPEDGLISNLRKARADNDTAKMILISQDYTKSSEFVDSLQKVEPGIIEFVDVVHSKAKNYNSFVRENFERIFATTAAQLIEKPLYQKTFVSISEGLVAAAIDNTVTPGTKSLITRIAKALQVITLLSKEAPVTREQVAQINIALPSGIFPLPVINTNLKEHRKKQSEIRKKAAEEKQKKTLELSETLKTYNAAINELLKTFDNNTSEDDGLPSTDTKKKGGFFMPKKAIQKISVHTKDTLKKIGLNTEEIDVAKTVGALERQAAETAQEIYANAGNGSRLVRIGSNDIAVTDDDLAILETGINTPRSPGACPPVNIEAVDAATPIPTGGRHDVRILGIADLLMVEQELARYEPGEIAHIENVLKSEFRERKHRINNLTEESVTTETEETDTKENDLSSTERFELQVESQKVINESTSMTAGATISASYGFVDATANFNYATSDSSSETQRSASNFARETTAKAVNKVEKRSLESRFRRTVRETEEINQHTFDNKAGTDNITGVYRFIDKIYNAQIVNYGKRLMLEFIVPEPAAFLRHAMTSQPVETTILKPEEPGYCTGYGRRFIQLQVQDIDRNNYLFWAGKYGVEDVSSPPSQTIVVSAATSSSLKEMEQIIERDNDKEYVNAKSLSINIPDGYSPVNADIQIDAQLMYKDESDDVAFIHLLIDKENITKSKLNQFVFSPGVWKNVAVAINTFNKVSYAVLINIYCRLLNEKEQQWKMETFNAIMNAYKDQLTRYNNAVETARIRAGFSEIAGINPLVNRETEKTELKRGCLSLLTGQLFESFDAMNSNVGAYGYPEIDFDEAAEEGRFISFFEQAFEWNNMTYVFYPYFWANKQQWLQLSQLKDADPLFAKFLQAGSCRVNLPIRTGFETSMLNYISNDIIWYGEGTLLNSEGDAPDAFHISVVEELKGQLNNMNMAGTGKLTVKKGSNVVTGVDTVFSSDDENKRIIINSKTYIIQEVDSSTAIQLKTAYAGDTQTGLTYSFGAKLVGDSWEVKLPTNLVKIDTTDPAI